MVQSRKNTVAGRRIGYARVPADEQATDPQLEALRLDCGSIEAVHQFVGERATTEEWFPLAYLATRPSNVDRRASSLDRHQLENFDDMES